MCMGGSSIPEEPKAPPAPTVLEQKAPKSSKKDEGREKRKRQGSKAFRSDAMTIGGVSTSGASVNTPQ